MSNILEKAKAVTKLSKIRAEVNKPELLIGVGAAAILIGVYEACKSTLDLEEEVNNLTENVNAIKDAWVEDDTYPDKEYRKDLAFAYSRGIMRIGGLYLKPAGYIFFGYACIFKANNIMRARNVALAAAYNTLSDKYEEYRNRVIEEYGEEADEHFYYGTEKSTTDLEVVDTKTGRKKKVKDAKVLSVDKFTSIYARSFDTETSYLASPSWEYNKTWLEMKEAEANNILTLRGYLFLDEVYRMLGYEDTMAAHQVGWMKNGSGDGFVSFNISTYWAPNATTTADKVIITDFNVDGEILTKLGELGIGDI